MTLPPLPPYIYGRECVPNERVWTERDMRAYAEQCIAAERERCAQIVGVYRVPVGNSAAGEMAAEWTMDALREIRDAIRGA